MFDTFLDWTSDVLVHLYVSFLPSPRIEHFCRHLESYFISTLERAGSGMPLVIGRPICYMLALFVHCGPLAVLVYTCFSCAMPDNDLIFYVDDEDDDTDDQTDLQTNDDDDYDDDDHDDMADIQLQPLVAAPPQEVPRAATEYVLPPASLRTPPSSPSSSRSSPPSSPSSLSSSSFSQTSTALSEEATPILTSAYLIKIVAMAKFIQTHAEYLDTDEKRAGAFAYGLSIIKAEETRERAFDAFKMRRCVDQPESDEVRHARMEARIQSHLFTYILSLYPVSQPFPIRPSFRPIQSSPKPKTLERSSLPFPIPSRSDPAADPFQSLALLRAAAYRPQIASRYRRSSTQSHQAHIAASFGVDGSIHLRRSAIVVAAQKRETSSVLGSSSLEREIGPVPEYPAAHEPSSKLLWSDLDESDDDDYLSTPPVFENDPVNIEVEQPTGPAASPVKLLWSDLVDLDDDDEYFAIPPTFEDDDKIEVVVAEQPASPTAYAPLRWSDLVDLEDDDDDEYFASPPFFDSDKPESAVASRPAGPAAAPHKLLWSDLVDLDDADEYFVSPPMFDC